MFPGSSVGRQDADAAPHRSYELRDEEANLIQSVSLWESLPTHCGYVGSTDGSSSTRV